MKVTNIVLGSTEEAMTGVMLVCVSMMYLFLVIVFPFFISYVVYYITDSFAVALVCLPFSILFDIFFNSSFLGKFFKNFSK